MSRQLIFGLILFLLLITFGNTCMPRSFGDENGVIEISQVTILIGAMIISFFKARRAEGHTRLLWIAGILFCMLLAGREISWGRVFFPPMENGNFPPVKALPYGVIVYPLITITMLSIVVLIIRGKIITYFRTHDMSLPLHTLLAMTALVAADAEKFHLLPHTNAMLVEELCEMYAYAIFAYILYKMKAS